jgi:branched-chain amino acid transport system ATP-binding protein
MSDDDLLVVRGLTKRFGGLVASNGIDLTVGKRQTHALIGPNGAGKTTFISQLCGDLQPDAGTIHFGGEDITRWPTHQRARAGLKRSFQITSVMPTLSAIENVHLAAAAAHGRARNLWRPLTGEKAARADALAAIERVGLAGREALPAHTLSHGEQRQLEIAMTIAGRPRMLLLDEPAAGTGASDSARITELIRQLGRDYAILLVEHDMDMVFAVADRITVLANGTCIATGTPAEIRDNAAVRQAYLGD